ncbi:MAG: peptidase S9 [Gammaproteobacteria bacterium]|jgi:acetyl esterase/lipase|nr:peptidase S9 [Gammaproteobacteria bacterium]HJN95742.1 alpha/beta hydrolase [Gammaproteobacteria bacterium]|tara:strand:+ start:19943 stop:20791 length:849 start_codon:yes stop_codon:yes gene_type:complete
MRLIKSYLALIVGFTICASSYADVEIKADVVYGHKDGMALVYDVLQPENANGAAVVFMVSGGWFSRWAPPENRVQQFGHFLDAGFTVIPVHHGSAPRYHVPDAFTDVSRAIRHIKLHAENHGIDADRIGVTGGSAGGHLSLMLGLAADAGDSSARDEVMRQGNSVAAVVAYFPPVDLREITGPNDRFPALNFSNEKAAAISPILHADAEDPPTLLIHGDADDLVNISASQIMQAEFQKQNVVSEFITIPGAGHGFRGDDAVLANNASVAWFQKHLLEGSFAD